MLPAQVAVHAGGEFVDYGVKGACWKLPTIKMKVFVSQERFPALVHQVSRLKAQGRVIGVGRAAGGGCDPIGAGRGAVTPDVPSKEGAIRAESAGTFVLGVGNVYELRGPACLGIIGACAHDKQLPRGAQGGKVRVVTPVTGNLVLGPAGDTPVLGGRGVISEIRVAGAVHW